MEQPPERAGTALTLAPALAPWSPEGGVVEERVVGLARHTALRQVRVTARARARVRVRLGLANPKPTPLTVALALT